MKHIKTLETRNLCDSAKNGACGADGMTVNFPDKLVAYLAGN